MPRVLLVNTNTMRPPVAPIALDYLASALDMAGLDVAILDLAFIEQARIPGELLRALDRYSPSIIGVTIRNTDDCSMATRSFVMPQIAKWIDHVTRHCDAPVVVGGVGYSIFPREIFDYLSADYGIAGEGELAFSRLAEALVLGKDPGGIPGLLWRRPNGKLAFNPPKPLDPAGWPLPARRFVDNARYMREGGMVGIETKRGCNAKCVYCADPVAKGKSVRCRPPKVVVEEIRGLLDQGADVFHTCDSEFNIPVDHGLEVCKAIREAGLGDRIRWYAYCTPAGFDAATARLYRQAGCRGINFGCDSGSDKILARLKRRHRRRDIAQAVAAAKSAGLSCLVDLLLGVPGESRDSIAETIEMARSVGADRVGLSIGVRVYPRTPLARDLFSHKKVPHHERSTEETQPDLLQPYFWVEPALGESIHSIVRELVGHDPLFLFLDAARADASYNYSNNRTLVSAIRKGYRGAFWDILRRVAENLPPE